MVCRRLSYTGRSNSICSAAQRTGVRRLHVPETQDGCFGLRVHVCVRCAPSVVAGHCPVHSPPDLLPCIVVHSGETFVVVDP
eukprot:10410971-Alexandrium_andersonii.AAC.1